MARPKLGDSDTERLHLKITQEEITAIDDWRFANRVPSRSEAVRRLCQIGLLLGDNVQGLAGAAIGMSEGLTSLKKEAFEVWCALANPGDKAEKLDRHAAIEIFEILIQRIEAIETANDDVSTVAVYLFEGAVGMARNDARQGKNISTDTIEKINELLRSMREDRANMRESRRRMSEAGYKNTPAGEDVPK